MSAQSIQSLYNIFSFCTFKIFRNHSADLLPSPSGSLADYLITSQRHPITLENLEDSSFVEHRYFLVAEHFANKSAAHHFKLQSRHPCHNLLLDYNGVTNDLWRNREGTLLINWRGWITQRILRGLAGFRETPNFLIFQDFPTFYHNQYFSFFKRSSHTFAVTSKYIWLTNAEAFLFCQTCPSELMKLSQNQLISLKRLQLYWKELHKNLNFAQVVHSGSGKTECSVGEKKKDEFEDDCVYGTLSRKFNYTVVLIEYAVNSNEIISTVIQGLATPEQVNKWVLETMDPRGWPGIGVEYDDYNFQVFITTRVTRTSSVAGLLSPFDVPTWIAFSVTVITTSVLFWIILDEGDSIKSLSKGISWLLLTLLEQSVEPLKSNHGNKNM